MTIQIHVRSHNNLSIRIGSQWVSIFATDIDTSYTLSWEIISRYHNYIGIAISFPYGLSCRLIYLIQNCYANRLAEIS